MGNREEQEKKKQPGIKTTTGVKAAANPRFKNVVWPKIKPGDIIDLVAPGFGPTPKEIRGAVKFLREWGLNPRVPVDLLGPDILCSNSDEKRFHFLRKALFAKDSKAIWCLRGGYGANRLLPYLQRLKSPASNKVLIGYSDVTTVHLFLNQQWGWNTIHGPFARSIWSGLGAEQRQEGTQRLPFWRERFFEVHGVETLKSKSSSEWNCPWSPHGRKSDHLDFGHWNGLGG
jgi:muramoyltetrapeptide carboxypeptidase